MGILVKAFPTCKEPILTLQVRNLQDSEWQKVLLVEDSWGGDCVGLGGSYASYGLGFCIGLVSEKDVFRVNRVGERCQWFTQRQQALYFSPAWHPACSPRQWSKCFHWLITVNALDPIFQ